MRKNVSILLFIVCLSLFIGSSTKNNLVNKTVSNKRYLEASYQLSSGEYLIEDKIITNIPFQVLQTDFPSSFKTSDGDIKLNCSNKTNFVGTGCKLSIYKNDTEQVSYNTVVKGDLNGDGKGTLTDIFLLATKDFEKETDDAIKKAADINYDSSVKDADISIMADYLLQKKNFPDDPSLSDVENALIKLENKSIIIEKSQSLKINATLTSEGAYISSYKSDNESVATVDTAGVVTAINVGTANITLTASNGKTAIVKVTVEVSPTGISLSDTNIELEKDKTKEISATISPSDATNKNVSWSSSDTKVVTVDEKGKVTAVGTGSAVITASTYNGKSAKANVKVIILPTEIKFSENDIKINASDTKQLSVTFFPSNATEKNITWSSSNTSVATVDENGKVTGVKQGTATITAKTSNGKTTTVTVKVASYPTSIALNKTSLSIEKGRTATLTATITPKDVDDDTITWKSSNTSVATVDNTGKVTAIAGGTATITATTVNGKYASTSVKVVIYPTSIKLNYSSLKLNPKETMSLTATLSPSNATEKTITYKSSNTSVATVDASGKITAVANGTATITATTANNKSTTCTVTVGSYPTTITLNKTSLTMEKGKTQSITATVTGSDVFGKTVTWSSSNTSVATVDASGKITAVGTGTTDIITKASDGKTATVKVTVQVSATGISLSPTSLSIEKGGTSTLTANISPSDVTNKKVTWSSSNTSVATVDANGKVKGITTGTANITAKTANGKTAAAKVNVVISPSKVDITTTNMFDAENRQNDYKAIGLEKGQTETLKATISPSTVTANKKVTWSSSDTSAVTVGANSGVVKAVTPGKTATITAKTANGKTATFKVTVLKFLTKVTITADTSRAATITPTDGIATSQSLCIVGSNFVTAVESDDTKQAIQVYKKSDGTKTNSGIVRTDLKHANGMTYNPTTKKIYVTPINGGQIVAFNASGIASATKLTGVTKYTFSSAVGGIAWDSSTSQYYIVSGRNLYVADSNFNKLKHYKKVRVGTGQDIGAYKGLILAPVYNYQNSKSSLNELDIYKASTGAYLGTYKINTPDGYELESLDYYGSGTKFAMLFNVPGDNAIYKVNLKNLPTE